MLRSCVISNPPMKRRQIFSLESTVILSMMRYTKVSEYSVGPRSSAEISPMTSLALNSITSERSAVYSIHFFCCFNFYSFIGIEMNESKYMLSTDRSPAFKMIYFNVLLLFSTEVLYRNRTS